VYHTNIATDGGPGCSGLLGLGTEFGPFLFEKDGILSSNPNTWNQVANILYVEQPAGVGFSYYTDESDRKVGDNRAAVDNYQLIVEFLNRFPERRSNEFYIASESYGGHYIPHLAREILDRNTEGAINFRGFLIGNPYVDPFSNDVTMVQTYYMHGLIALPLFLKWETHCTDPNHYPADECGVIMDAMFKESGDGINPYALDFPVCTEQDNDDYPPTATRSHSYNEDEVDFVLDDEVDFVLDANEISATSAIKRNLVSGTASAQSTKLMKHSSARAPPFLPQQDVYYPCAENHLFDYLNREDVKVALHVEQSKDWSMCSDEIEYSEQDSNSPQMSVYEDLLDRARVRGTNLKIMIFSGDDDSGE
jgi:serine carboxypeptidase-like clade 2